MFIGSRKLNERSSVALIELAAGSVIIQASIETSEGVKLQQMILSRESVLMIGVLILELAGNNLTADSKVADA